MKQSINLLALASLSVIFPASAYGLSPHVESPLAVQSGLPIAAAVAQRPSGEMAEAADTLRVNIEDRIQGTSDSINREYTFQGNANEMIVVYVDALQGSLYDTSMLLVDAEGQAVASKPSYHQGLDLAETEGRHRIFLLPATGEYRLQFVPRTTDPEYYETYPPETIDYLLRVRLAPYAERLIILGSRMMDEGHYEEAIDIFVLAIEESPEQPLPYVGRLIATAEPFLKALDEESLFDGEEDVFEVVYRLFQDLTPEIQVQLISDMRQTGTKLEALIVNGKTTVEQADLDPAILLDGAVFLETGVVSETMRNFFENEL
ncbi:MAG: hypothetical protein AB8B99_01730 [Phormidesmis sp.]